PAMIQPTGGLALSVNASGQSVGGSNVSINASGQYVGGPGVGIDTGSFNGNSSLTSNGTTTALPGFFSPLAINNAGQVVGFLDVGSGGGTGLHPAIYQQGQLTDLSSKTATGQFTDSKAIAINQGGDILVNSFSTAGNSASFLYHSSTGIVTELTGPPGMTNFMAAALNDKNQIVGGGSLDNNGTFQLLASLLRLNSSWSSLNATGITDS